MTLMDRASSFLETYLYLNKKLYDPSLTKLQNQYKIKKLETKLLRWVERKLIDFNIREKPTNKQISEYVNDQKKTFVDKIGEVDEHIEQNYLYFTHYHEK